MKFTVTTSQTTLATLVASDPAWATILAEARENGPWVSVVIYNNHSSESVYIEVGGKDATTTTAHPIKADKSFSFYETDLNKVKLIAGASNDSIYITICK